MPLESQSRAPLASRDRKLIVMLAGLAAAAGVAAGIIAATSSAPQSTRSCIVVDLPSTVGGAHLTRCGKAAAALCRTQSSTDRRIASACRKYGYTTR